MRRTTLQAGALLALALMTLAACDSVGPELSAPGDVADLHGGQARTVRQQTGHERVGLCHYDADADAFHPLTVAAHAAAAHLAHGDGRPGEPVPGREGHVFGDDCTAEAPASAITIVLDQDQATATAYIGGFRQTGMAQSFQTQQAHPTSGAGVHLRSGVGSSDEVRISLWTALPTAGGTMLAEGTARGTAGQWVDVFWAPVTLAPNTTYYLVFDGNTTLGLSGVTSDRYPYGHVFANGGFAPFPTFDFAFRTWVAAPAGSALP